MQINTKKLRDAAQAEIDRRDAAQVAQYETAVAQYEQRKAKWLGSPRLDETVKLLRAFAKRMSAGQVVTANEVTAAFRLNSYREEPVFLSVGPPEKPTPREHPELRALITFLDSVEDKTVSSSTLRDFGFRNLRQLL